MDNQFQDFLDHASEVVGQWPEWRQNLLGGPIDVDAIDTSVEARNKRQNCGFLHMMDFKYYRFLLLSLSDELREVADGLKIVDFMEKLKQFCRCDPSPDDSANDEVVDVVVVWVAKHNPVSV